LTLEGKAWAAGGRCVLGPPRLRGRPRPESVSRQQSLPAPLRTMRSRSYKLRACQSRSGTHYWTAAAAAPGQSRRPLAARRRSGPALSQLTESGRGALRPVASWSCVTEDTGKSKSQVTVDSPGTPAGHSLRLLLGPGHGSSRPTPGRRPGVPNPLASDSVPQQARNSLSDRRRAAPPVGGPAGGRPGAAGSRVRLRGSAAPGRPAAPTESLSH
jgi:hypothetical protein